MKTQPNKLTRNAKIAIAGSAAAGVPILWWLFFHFGLDILYVLVPIAGGTVAAYRIHLNRLAQKTKEISEASRIHLATVEALASAIDARDGDGVGHVRRVQIYAVGIGRMLGLAESDINALRTGALLHGIGKLAIPDHILNKPGTLTSAEMEKAKIHCEVGAAILKKIGFGYPVVPTVKYHNERWDGRGYPEGRAGETIPLTARILAVADVFDTLRGSRPYRPAKSREAARQIMLAEAGSRFDPSVVDLLLRNLNRLEGEIRAEGLDYVDAASASSPVHTYVEQIKLANREVFSLYELAREFGGATSLEETLELFTNTIREFVPFDTCAVYLNEAGNKRASVVHVDGDNADLLASHSVTIEQGATGLALKTAEKVYNVDPDLDFYQSLPELTQVYTALISLPLIVSDNAVGAVTLYSRTLDNYGEEHLRLLETITRIAADAIDKSAEHDEARTHALTDPMTGLPNARSFQLQFEKEVARASRTGSSFQLLMLDLDGFKLVNDSFGHKVGDMLLKEVGAVIRAELREYDFLARYGGDEFVALVPDTTSEGVDELCLRIEHAVRSYSLQVTVEQAASVGVSLGSAGYPHHGDSFDELVIAADKIMYERKSNRKRMMATTNVADWDRIVVDAEIAPSTEPMIVELDETAVLSSRSIN